MRNTKRVFSNFDYRECDAFAEYLHRQSLQGWHFKEWKNWRETSIAGLLLTLLYLYEFWTYYFEKWIFSNFMLLVLVMIEMTAICRMADAVLLKTWENRKRRELEQGEALSFGNCKSMTVFGRFFFFLFIVGMIWNVENAEQSKILLATGILLLFLILLNMLLSFWRPLEIDNGFIQFFAIMFIIVALGIFMRQGVDGTYFYFIRYPEYVVQFYAEIETELEQKEVQDIRDKLELQQ